MWPFDEEEDQSSFEYQRPKLLEDIINQEYVSPEARDLAFEIDRGARDIAAAGIDPGEVTPRAGFWSELFDTLDAPRQGIAGIADALLRGDFGSEEVGTGFRRGQEENITTSDILRRHTNLDPVTRAIAGFGGDLISDPLNWISFGTAGTAKAGGKALTEAGLALKAEGVQRLSSLGISDILQQDQVLDEAFRAISRGQEASEALKGSTTAATNAFHAKKLQDSEDVFSSLFRPDEVLGKEVFEKNKLRIGMNLPFLGHVIGGKNTSTEIVAEAPGLLGQTARGIEAITKPAQLTLAELDISDDLADAFQYLDSTARNLAEATVDAVAQIPVVGEPVANMSKATARVASGVKRGFQEIFNRAAIVGAENAEIITEQLNAIEGTKVIARNRTIDILGEEGLRNSDDLKDAWLLIDEVGSQAVKRGNLDPIQTEAILKRLGTLNQVHDGDMAYLRSAFETPIPDAQGVSANILFRQELNAKLQDPNIRDSTKQLVAKLTRAFDELSIQEAESGLQHGFLENYVVHKYRNLDRNPFSTGGGKTAFMNARKYDSLSQAFEVSGKVADTDIPLLLESRIQRSLQAQAQRSFAHRLMLENSMPEHIIQGLYREALADPSGPAASVLKRNRWGFTPKDVAVLGDGAIIAQRAKLLGKEGPYTPEELTLLQQSFSEFADTTHKQMMAAGTFPKAANMPAGWLGELGTEVEVPGGGKVFLPTPVANAYKEVSASRDLLKDKFGESAIGSALVRAADYTTNLFKRLNTIPWPAYWGQNALGDRFRQMTGGINAMLPGAHARTLSVMYGKSSIKNSAGQILDKAALERVINSNGIRFSAHEYLGTIEAYADMDIDKLLRTKKSMITNLMEFKEKGASAALLTQAQEKLHKSFDGFFRVSEIVRNFENGSSIPDAVRAAERMYFNYNDMTAIEKSYFKRFYLFYNYMSKATRTTFTDLFTNPGNIGSQLHMTNAMAELFSSPDALPTAEEVDLRLLNGVSTIESLSRVVGKSPEGNPIMGRGFGAPVSQIMGQLPLSMPRNLSVGEIGDALGESGKRFLQRQFAAANPIINSAAQALSGKNLYFDRPLSSEFLRKLPSLNALAENLSGIPYNELPLDLDGFAKEWLGAVPDGKGRLIADQGKFWILTQVIPGLSRLTSTVGSFTNENIPLSAAMLRFTTGVNLDDQDVSRSYLGAQKDRLNQIREGSALKSRLRAIREEDEQYGGETTG